MDYGTGKDVTSDGDHLSLTLMFSVTVAAFVVFCLSTLLWTLLHGS
jgi:hypothetical protein